MEDFVRSVPITCGEETKCVHWVQGVDNWYGGRS